jgi:uncharacterized DUF497 family protein
MKYFTWNEEKNEQLKQERNISFEEIVVQIENGHILDILTHPNDEKYPDQMIMIVECNQYGYLVPYVETDDEIFLKTIIPSRKATKKYLDK